VTAQSVARVSLVVVLFVVVQQVFLLGVRIDGAHPDVMVLLVVAAAVAGGPRQGALMGFGAGLVADLFLPTPFGLSALTGCLVGFGVGLSTVAFDDAAWWLPTVAALIGSAVYEVGYGMLGVLLGQPQMMHVDYVAIVLVVSLTNTILAVPAVRIVGWSLPAPQVESVPSVMSSPGVRR